jgi:hypothetical protein
VRDEGVGHFVGWIPRWHYFRITRDDSMRRGGYDVI